MSAWRGEPGWVLVEWMTDKWDKQPSNTPDPRAELTGGGAWCAVFVDHRPIAHWFNPERTELKG